MYCSKCGNEINEDSLFCPKCGAKVDTRVNNDEQSPIVEDNVVSNDRAVEKTTEVKELEIKGGFPMSNMEIVYPTSDVAITEEQAVTMAEFLKERFGNEKNVEFKVQRIVGAENKERWGVYLMILA